MEMKLKKLYLESMDTDMDNDVKKIADQLGSEIKDVLTQSGQVEEAIDVTTLLSVILASNTILNLLSGWTSSMMRKYNITKGQDAVQKINAFTHKMENDFKFPIRKVVSLFVKDKNVAEKITNALFLILVLSLALKCGADAYTSALKSKTINSIMSGIKTVAKGVDIVAIIKKLASR